ncbi:MAG TPA: hypothetical protein VLF94_05665 [Chlamydiales bacterium]|nr:hypothetical protein [Chlamydiales bacterium]
MTPIVTTSKVPKQDLPDDFIKDLPEGLPTEILAFLSHNQRSQIGCLGKAHHIHLAGIQYRDIQKISSETPLGRLRDSLVHTENGTREFVALVHEKAMAILKDASRILGTKYRERLGLSKESELSELSYKQWNQILQSIDCKDTELWAIYEIVLNQIQDPDQTDSFQRHFFPDGIRGNLHERTTKIRDCLTNPELPDWIAGLYLEHSPQIIPEVILWNPSLFLKILRIFVENQNVEMVWYILENTECLSPKDRSEAVGICLKSPNSDIQSLARLIISGNQEIDLKELCFAMSRLDLSDNPIRQEIVRLILISFINGSRDISSPSQNLKRPITSLLNRCIESDDPRVHDIAQIIITAPQLPTDPKWLGVALESCVIKGNRTRLRIAELIFLSRRPIERMGLNRASGASVRLNENQEKILDMILGSPLAIDAESLGSSLDICMERGHTQAALMILGQERPIDQRSLLSAHRKALKMRNIDLAGPIRQRVSNLRIAGLTKLAEGLAIVALKIEALLVPVFPLLD